MPRTCFKERRAVRRGFSLVELATVIIIAGILSSLAIPAMSSIDEGRRAAAADEVERRLLAARSEAVLLSRPVGVRIDPVSSTLQQWTIVAPGEAPTVALSALGVSEDAESIPSRFPGASIVSLVGGTGAAGPQILWFDYDGTPHARSDSGTRLGGWTRDAEVSLAGGFLIRVRRGSGTVDR